LIFDRSGNLYCTTYYAGAHDVGTVYKLTHRDDSWIESGLYSFKGAPDGSSPISTLVRDAAGNLYGTTSEGRHQRQLRRHLQVGSWKQQHLDGECSLPLPRRSGRKLGLERNGG
jgi:uncharacterized repeat protein (TIGR03803 family)